MMPAPVFVVDLPGSARWSWLTRSLAGACLLLVLAWWAGPAPEADAGLRFALVLLAGAACLLALVFSFSRPYRLRLDGAGWSLVQAAVAGQPGRLSVALDLGGMLLLRFDASGARARGRTHWLAVDRRSLGGQWHALRCAVYSAPPELAPRPPGLQPHLASNRAAPHE